MKKRRIITLLSAFVSMFALLPLTQASAATATVARWDFNETTAAHRDSSGNGITATSGNEVQNTGQVIRTVWVNDLFTKTHPGRLTRANHSRLNPGTGDFAVTLRFRTKQNYGNVIQKGQSGIAGGYWKWEIPNGKLMCLFRGVSGEIAVNSGTLKLNDNAWHTVTCSRIGTNVTMNIDNGRSIRRGSGVIGSISNTMDLTMMGKGSCNQVKVGCDYFVGDFDFVQIDGAPVN